MKRKRTVVVSILLLLFLMTTTVFAAPNLTASGSITTVQKDSYVEITATGSANDSRSSSQMDYISVDVYLFKDDLVTHIAKGGRFEYNNNTVSKSISYNAYFSGVFELFTYATSEDKNGNTESEFNWVTKSVTNNCRICVNSIEVTK